MFNKVKVNVLSLTILIILSSLCSPIEKALVYSKIDDFEVDFQDNLILIKGSQLFNIDAQSKPKQIYADPSSGNIHSVFYKNSMNIMVYYHETQRILFLDNTLSIKGNHIDLSEPISLACLSYNSGFWIYSLSDFSLFRFDRFMNKTNSSINLNQFLSSELSPSALYEFDNYLALSDTSEGVLLFDIFGTYLKTIPIKNITDFQMIENKLIYLKSDSLYSLDIQNFESNLIKTDLKGVQKFRLSKRYLYFLDINGDLFKETISY